MVDLMPAENAFPSREYKRSSCRSSIVARGLRQVVLRIKPSSWLCFKLELHEAARVEALRVEAVEMKQMR